MKRIIVIFICILALISCEKDGDGGSKLPKSGEWNVTTDFGSFLFTVNTAGTYITEIAITHSNWSCGGVTLSGTVSVSSDPGWPITNQQFSIEKSLDPFGSNQELSITGTFSDDGEHASGSWSEIVYGTTCSGVWEVDF